MSAGMLITAAQVEAEIEVYLYLRKKLAYQERLRQRLTFIVKTPVATTLEDLEAIEHLDKATRYHLFKRQPALREQYRDYQEDSSAVLSSIYGFMVRAHRHTGVKGHFIDGWHLKAICQEWEAGIRGDFERLMINQPPGTIKSYISNVIVPAYRFAIDPKFQLIQLSYNKKLPQRDGQTLLTLMQSDWYRRRFPHVQLIKATPEYLETSDGGYRWGTGLGASVTGWHPKQINIDDPHKAADVAANNAQVKKVITNYASTIPTRGAIQYGERNKTLIAIIMQRLGVNDLCGVILKEGQFDGLSDDIKLMEDVTVGFQWRHVCLPMYYDPAHPYVYEHDARTVKGEPLWPEALPKAKVENMIEEFKIDPERGGKTTASQFDQNPLKSEGNLFDLSVCYVSRDDIRIEVRNGHGRWVRAWDRADSVDGNPTAGCLMNEYDELFYIMHMHTMKKRHAERDEWIERIAKADIARFGTRNYRVACEKLAGADGQQAFDALYARLSKLGIITMAMPPIKDKTYRATTLAADMEYGRARVLAGQPWYHDFHNEFRLFPNGPTDDQVDAAAHARTALDRWRQGEV